MNPFSLFDKAYVLNLDSRPERWKSVASELRRVDLFEKATRIPGVVHPDPKVGCSLGHLECLKRALKDGSKRPLFLEDDVRFFGSFEETLSKACQSIPKDLEFLYLGYNLDPSSPSALAPTFVNANLVRLRKCLTTHAYSISGKYLMTVTRKFEELLRKKGSPPDIVYADMDPVAYGVYPMVAFQQEGFSDIERRMVKYTLRENVESVIRNCKVIQPK